MIGIKMKMPKCCDECRFIEDEPEEEYDFSETKYCGVNNNLLNRVNTSEERHPLCPLVEIRGGKL